MVQRAKRQKLLANPTGPLLWQLFLTMLLRIGSNLEVENLDESLDLKFESKIDPTKRHTVRVGTRSKTTLFELYQKLGSTCLDRT